MLRLLRPETLRNLLLSAVSTLVMVGLLEAGLRYSGSVPTYSLEYATPGMWAVNPGPFRPGQSYVDRFIRDLPYHVSINRHGLRGPDFERPKPEDRFRILALGDSYTYGTYVGDDDTWPAALQTELRRRHAGGVIEVINAGISGFTIVDELAFMKEHGLALQPDLVVLAMCLNDLADLTRSVPQREELRRFSAEDAASPLTPLKRVLRRTATYNFLFLMKAKLMVKAGRAPTAHQVPVYHALKRRFDEHDEQLLARYRAHLGEMKELLDREGVPMVLLIFPLAEQLGAEARDAVQHRLVTMAAELGITTVDLLPSFREGDPGGRRYYLIPRDQHPSPEGYRKAAAQLASAIGPILDHGRASSVAAAATPAVP